MYRSALLIWLLASSTVLAQAKTDTVFDKTLRSCAFILAPFSDGTSRAATGTGSYVGFAPKTNLPVVITNYHVVSPCVKENGKHSDVRVMFPVKNSKGEVEQSRSKYLQSSGDPSFTCAGKILAYSKTKDLALVELQLEARALPRGMTTLPLAANTIRPSTRVHTIGNTGAGGMWSYTEGSVRSIYEKKFSVQLSPSETLNIEARMIESSNPTNKGDSGGPLVNDEGELVGVTQGGVVSANQLSTFIELSEVKALLKEKKITVPRRATTVVQNLTSKSEKTDSTKDAAKTSPEKPTARIDPRETAAESKLRFAKRALQVKDYGIAEDFLKQILADYDDTKAVVEAKSMLEEIKKARK